ncbi:GDP-mannose--glycolipid 4-beta-D-mannosyltransferase [Herbiconiux sp. VKM Ac-1786]|uniref:GDP-mannose--glycolipid 4-beta-D-mannosyltransferase n=1 Tax=Herbiconiux sp. VKM Ac-1786 TaxID=2783824 RepID=UPI00188C3D66|nr:GDP-mannose--glycolipid 4-beta-D-mannosyltransferase [Herbiconiux sp. VKM Ac-1786]MBF4572938.1 GDP-mannose--glycolipid 4-beta-D-mannosyltransferase [Herbiconiux sp. VKM Ac-1786]
MARDTNRTGNDRRILVMFSVPPPTESTNPYIPLLAHAVRGELVEVSYFSWRSAFLRRVDVLHVHWPELLVRRPSALKSALRSLAGLALLLKLRLTSAKIVWTVHNLRPHESGPVLERLFLRWFYRSVDHRIYINDSAENVGGPSTTILHGNYSGWYRPAPDGGTSARSGLLFFGLVRPYKGIESLLAAYGGLTGNTPALTIAGKPNSGEYRSLITARASELPGLTLRLGHQSDDELSGLVHAAEVVVLPYTQMYNSGALILALSLGAHVLAPRTPANQAMLEEFGDEWITLFDGPLESRHLLDALGHAAGAARGALPDMSRRDWGDAGDRHVQLYRRLLGGA